MTDIEQMQAIRDQLAALCGDEAALFPVRVHGADRKARVYIELDGPRARRVLDLLETLRDLRAGLR